MLPVNHAMVRKIEKCDNYTLDKWRQFLSHDSDQGLEYCLNIIYDLMENNVEWTHNFLLTDGLTVIEGYIAEKVSHKES